ncbi:amidase [Chloropicon primus]|uniref:Amidase n=1 Tax=Chloropicon primus TaxID=1764295 RepID=A0A5B8MPP8_9CHLO|nr:amidase [Chloropicon primus]UPR01244.1 amidase [Chloropicon primus]|eukprot:QDZ22024.1 amidase [Chloropicon primus]
MSSSAASSSPTPTPTPTSSFTERLRVVDPHPQERPPLHTVTVAVKDIMDMEGCTTGFGHPLWRLTHEPATTNAAVVQTLLGCGASIVGRTHMDELAWSLFGENHHFGTPPNPAAPGAVPGGSSSGSASAVAAGEADVGIGTDTGGSVRVPASWCGLFGIRPSHGRVSLQGARALAPSFDTCGWLTRDAGLLRRVGRELLDPRAAAGLPRREWRWLVAADAFDLADAETAELIFEAVSSRREDLARVFSPSKAPPQEVALDHLGGGFDKWFETFRVLQSREVWETLGPWVEEHDPEFGPGVKERFEYARVVPDSDVAAGNRMREGARRALTELLGEDGVVMLPTTPGPPPRRVSSPEVVTDLRARLLRLTSIAGLTGLPQVSVPVGRVRGKGPVGLSLLGPPDSDEDLLELAESLAEILLP